MFIVASCIAIGHCECSSKICSNWPDYFEDRNGCRTQGGVDKITMQLLSFIPIGLSSFYSGKRFGGFVELLHVIFLKLIIHCMEKTDNLNISDYIIEPIEMLYIFILLILDTAKIILAVTSEEALIEIIIFTLTMIISCYGYYIQQRRFHFMKALIMTGSMMVFQYVKHVLMVLFNIESDVNGCTLI